MRIQFDLKTFCGLLSSQIQQWLFLEPLRLAQFPFFHLLFLLRFIMSQEHNSILWTMTGISSDNQGQEKNIVSCLFCHVHETAAVLHWCNSGNLSKVSLVWSCCDLCWSFQHRLHLGEVNSKGHKMHESKHNRFVWFIIIGWSFHQTDLHRI